jgi:hypothetical protein
LYLRKLGLMLVALIAIAALVAGCGGGDSSSSSSSSASTGSSESSSTEAGGEAPTKAAFIKEADKICTEAENELNEEIVAFAKDKGISTKEEPSEDQEIEIFKDVVLPNIARQGEELEALTPPEGDESTFEDITSTLADEVAEAEEASGVPSKDTLAGATKKAKAYGFKSCGS